MNLREVGEILGGMTPASSSISLSVACSSPTEKYPIEDPRGNSIRARNYVLPRPLDLALRAQLLKLLLACKLVFLIALTFLCHFLSDARACYPSPRQSLSARLAHHLLHMHRFSSADMRGLLVLGSNYLHRDFVRG